MADEIRGLNVKFDADFSEFRKNMKNADKDINSTQKQLKSLQDSLKLEWNANKFAQAQEQARKALEATEEKANLLRKRLVEIDKAGVTDKTRDEYNYLSEQINKTELSAQKLKKQLEDLDDIELKHLTSGIDDATEKLDEAAQKTRGISTAFAAIGAGLVASGLNAVKQADDIATLATKYDMTTEAIQRFNYVALQTDTQSEDLYKAFVKVQGGVADLKTGIQSVSTQALQQLGLSFDQFNSKEEQFYAIIDALSRLEDQEKMVSLANDIFGEKMATNLFPLIYAGTDAIHNYRQEFEEMGALTDEQIQELAEFDNVMNELKTQYENIALQLGSGLLPVMEEFSSILIEDILPVIKELVEWYKNLDAGQQNFILTLIGILALLSPTLTFFSHTTSAISTLIQWLSQLDAATLTTYGNWALLVASVGTLFAVMANWSRMNPVQQVIALLGALTAVVLSAAVAFGVFHSTWSIGLAVAGIVAGIAAATAAIHAAGESIGSEVKLPDTKNVSTGSFDYNYNIPSTSVPQNTVTNNKSDTYVDNSTITINIEKNDYMTEDDIIQAVNKGLKEARLARS